MNSLSFKNIFSGCLVAAITVGCGPKAGPTVRAVPQTPRAAAENTKQGADQPVADAQPNAGAPVDTVSTISGMGEVRVAEGRQHLVDRLAERKATYERAEANLTKAEAELSDAIAHGRDASINLGSGLIEILVGVSSMSVGTRSFMDRGFLAVNYPSQSKDDIRQELLKADPNRAAPSMTQMVAQADKDLSTQLISTDVVVGETTLKFRGVDKNKFFSEVSRAYKAASLNATGKTFSLNDRLILTQDRWADYVKEVAKDRYKLVSEARAAALEAETASKLASIYRRANLRAGTNLTLIIGGIGATLWGTYSALEGVVGVNVSAQQAPYALKSVQKMKAQVIEAKTDFQDALNAAMAEGINFEVTNDSK